MSERFKVKITIVAEISSNEYDNIETMMQELSSETDYTISNTDNVTVHDTEFRDIEPI